MKKIVNIQGIDNKQRKFINSIFCKKHLLLGMMILSVSALSMSACGKKIGVVGNVETSTSVDVTPNHTVSIPQVLNKYGSDVQQPYGNLVREDDIWSHVVLYERDVRYYNDGSIGYSEWTCLGEHLVRSTSYLDSKLEYKYDFIGDVDVYDKITGLFGQIDGEVKVFGDSLISLQDLRFYKYFVRDFVDGVYTEWVNDGSVYIADKEYVGGDLVQFIECETDFSLSDSSDDLSLKLN